MTVSKVALAALSMMCGTAGLAASMAAAQVPAAQVPAAQAAPLALTLTPAERAALQALQAAASGYDRMAQDAALAAARPVVQGAHARFAFANYQFIIGRSRNDAQMQGQAVDMLVESGLVPASDLPPLIANQASRAYQAGENPRLERLLAQLVQLQPSDPVALADYAQFTAGRITNAGAAAAGQYRTSAVGLFQRALAAHLAAGRPAPESWYQRTLALAFDGRMAQPAISLARDLVTHYPNPLNWRDALNVYRQSVPPDPALDLDVRRLMRATESLTGERDYLELAQALAAASLHGEAKAVLDEGVARGMLDSGEAIVRQAVTASTRRASQERTGLVRLRTQALAAATGAPARAAGDSHFGQGQYAEAAELYRAALQKGGEDTNLVNSRLGAALALAGQRAEAEGAFRAVTGPRADLSAFWLAWLARRPG
jgi:tetratricopeptide (TPR) repeat protein